MELEACTDSARNVGLVKFFIDLYANRQLKSRLASDNAVLTAVASRDSEKWPGKMDSEGSGRFGHDGDS
jgi:hypothetical protein